jgi:hypothetical protein
MPPAGVEHLDGGNFLKTPQERVADVRIASYYYMCATPVCVFEQQAGMEQLSVFGCRIVRLYFTGKTVRVSR